MTAERQARAPRSPYQRRLAGIGIPRWTSYDPEPEQDKAVFQRSAQCWCYLCGAEHRRAEPCVNRRPARFADPRVACVVCGALYLPRKAGGQKYCTSACFTEARAARRKKGYDGRFG